MSRILPHVKICCISTPEEAALAISYGARALGLVSAMPSGPGVITEEKIAKIVRTIPPGIDSFLLTSLQDAPSIIAQQRATRVTTIQLVDAIDDMVFAELRRALGSVTLVQVIHVRNTGALAEATHAARFADALLLDSGNPALPVKELGGTGRRHDWSLSRTIRDTVGLPVYLAGGLHSGNVEEAIETVRPFGLDLCSGVRTRGQLDEEKLSAFMRAALR